MVEGQSPEQSFWTPSLPGKHLSKQLGINWLLGNKDTKRHRMSSGTGWNNLSTQRTLMPFAWPLGVICLCAYTLKDKFLQAEAKCDNTTQKHDKSMMSQKLITSRYSDRCFKIEGKCFQTKMQHSTAVGWCFSTSSSPEPKKLWSHIHVRSNLLHSSLNFRKIPQASLACYINHMALLLLSHLMSAAIRAMYK